MASPQNNPGYVDPKYLQKLGEYILPTKHRSFERMHIAAGQRVLDVGCGPATDTVPLAKLVGAGGQVVGIDYDEAMIAAAQQRAKDAGVGERVIHQQADATSIPYEDGYFDSCRSERMFQHLKGSERALAEMIRVTKPGGWVVVVDTDQASFAVDAAKTDLIWRLAKFRCETFNNGYSGRQLYGLFKQQHLLDVQVELFPVVVTDYPLARYFATLDVTEARAIESKQFTAQELDDWHQEAERLDAEGRFFGYANMMLVSGRKPE